MTSQRTYSKLVSRMFLELVRPMVSRYGIKYFWSIDKKLIFQYMNKRLIVRFRADEWILVTSKLTCYYGFNIPNSSLQALSGSNLIKAFVLGGDSHPSSHLRWFLN